MGITINSMANDKLNMNSIRLATGNRINSASDDASGMAIAEKLQEEINGLEQGMRNTADMSGLVATAEGGLSDINDSLQRIRELSVQASNGTLTDSDRGLIQEEIGQLIEGITGAVNNTQYNNKNLLDGSFANQNTASNPDGTGAQVSIRNMSIESLGIKGYDVTTDFDISKIDNAISSVNDTRSQLGALSNRFDYTMDSSSIALLNQAAARSRIADADIAKEATDYNKIQLTNDYQMLSQKQQQDNMRTQMNLLL